MKGKEGEGGRKGTSAPHSAYLWEYMKEKWCNVKTELSKFHPGMVVSPPPCETKLFHLLILVKELEKADEGSFFQKSSPSIQSKGKGKCQTHSPIMMYLWSPFQLHSPASLTNLSPPRLHPLTGGEHIYKAYTCHI